MRRVLVIGIGAGDPEHVTVQAINALNRADVVFLVDKPGERRDLVRLRREICDRYIDGRSCRIVDVPDLERDRAALDYRAAVDEWRQRRADAWEELIGAELGEEDCGAFLVWGDPAIYDGTLSVIDQVLARGRVEFEHEVISGISSVQALAAKHRIPLNRVGGPIRITTGRRLREDAAADADDVVVMLDGEGLFRQLADGDTHIYWGAYIGTADEILVSGKLNEVADEIARVRAEARERKGWIMDTYLLRKPDPPERRN
jgi:precorrin-6A synthase